MGWLATKDEKFRFQHRLNWPFGNFYKKFFDLFWCQWTLWTVSLETKSRGVKISHVPPHPPNFYKKDFIPERSLYHRDANKVAAGGGQSTSSLLPAEGYVSIFLQFN